MSIFKEEQSRLQTIKGFASDYAVHRKEAIAKHDDYAKELESERLDSLSWAEKRELTEKMVAHRNHDPRKYLPEYVSADCPYFGIVGIKDNDPKINNKEYVIGKQSLSTGSKIHVSDWRKSEVSRLWYFSWDL